MKKVCLITLGCPKNIVEGENMAGLLAASGWNLTTDLKKADAAVVHTCSFISDARKESEDVITAVSRLKKTGRLKKLAVTGCLVQSSGASIAEIFPDVDVFSGTGSLGSLPRALESGRSFDLSIPGGLLESSAPRLLSSALPSAYLRIAEGCNHKCSFCVIPSIRGRYRSRKTASVLREASELAGCGIKEIILIAQDTTLYGKDIYGKTELPALLKELCGIRGLKWIRLMYAYPSTINSSLVAAFNNEEKLCKYIDMPVQHVNDRMLSLMGRPTGIKGLIKRLKSRIPGLTLRSTLITGFPGETEKEFAELAGFVSEGWFDHLGVFEYSPAAGTPSSGFKGKITQRVAAERKKELMSRQRKVVETRYRALTGSWTEVMVESRVSSGKYFGRTVLQAPEIDGGALISGDCRVGAIVKAKVTGFKGYDIKVKA